MRFLMNTMAACRSDAVQAKSFLGTIKYSGLGHKQYRGLRAGNKTVVHIVGGAYDHASTESVRSDIGDNATPLLIGDGSRQHSFCLGASACPGHGFAVSCRVVNWSSDKTVQEIGPGRYDHRDRLRYRAPQGATCGSVREDRLSRRRYLQSFTARDRGQIRNIPLGDTDNGDDHRL